MADLPFLKSRKIASVILAKYKPGNTQLMPEGDTDEPDMSLTSAAEDLIAGIESKDAEAVAAALSAAFTILESQEQPEQEME